MSRKRRRRSLRLWELLVIAAIVAAVLWIAPSLSGGGPPSPAQPSQSNGAIPLPDNAFALTVEHVYDGDTIRAVAEKPNELIPTRDPVRVRLIGIDTPEGTPTVECWAEEARDHLRELLPEGSTVWAAADREPRDRYDRALLYLWTDDGTFINQELVAAGDAVAIRVGRNDAHYELLVAAQRSAEDARAGRWGAC